MPLAFLGFALWRAWVSLTYANPSVPMPVSGTAGQFAYIFALADTAHVAIAAPIISAYCVASVVWSRIFLKEKLSWKHYAMIALVVVGIVLLGFFDI